MCNQFNCCKALIFPFFSLLIACNAGNGDGTVAIDEPIEEGIRQEQFFSLESQDQSTFIATTLVDTGKQVFLVGGDALVVETNASRELLGSDSDFTIYSGQYPQNLNNQPVNFSVQYLPEETRKDRWYPADEVYVDVGAGSYTDLKWTQLVEFPEPISLLQPLNGDTFNSANDSFNIAWQDNATATEQVQIWATFDCFEKSLKLYPNPDFTVTEKAFSIQMKELFAEVGFIDLNDQDLVDTQNFIDLMFYGKKAYYRDIDDINSYNSYRYQPSNCSIHIHALVQKSTSVSEPFVGGTIIFHRSHTAAINYIEVAR